MLHALGTLIHAVGTLMHALGTMTHAMGTLMHVVGILTHALSGYPHAATLQHDAKAGPSRHGHAFVMLVHAQLKKTYRQGSHNVCDCVQVPSDRYTKYLVTAACHARPVV